MFSNFETFLYWMVLLFGFFPWPFYFLGVHKKMDHSLPFNVWRMAKKLTTLIVWHFSYMKTLTKNRYAAKNLKDEIIRFLTERQATTGIISAPTFTMLLFKRLDAVFFWWYTSGKFPIFLNLKILWFLRFEKQYHFRRIPQQICLPPLPIFERKMSKKTRFLQKNPTFVRIWRNLPVSLAFYGKFEIIWW